MLNRKQNIKAPANVVSKYFNYKHARASVEKIKVVHYDDVDFTRQ